MTHPLRTILVTIVLAIIGLAGILKLLSLDTFAQSLGTWSLLPGWAMPILTIAVPVFEVGLAVAWFATTRRLAVEVAAFAFLALATAVYAHQSLTSQPPDCGCLGLLQQYEHHLGMANDLLWRNGVLMAVLALSIVTKAFGQGRHHEPSGVHTT